MNDTPHQHPPSSWSRLGIGTASSVGRDLAQRIEDLGGTRPPTPITERLLPLLEEHGLIDFDPDSDEYWLLAPIDLDGWAALIAEAEERRREDLLDEATPLPPHAPGRRVRATPPSLPRAGD